LDFPIISLWDKKTLILHFAMLNIKTRFKQSYLGFFWSALEPLLYFGILYLVFTNIAGKDDELFPIYLITGILFFHVFIRGTTGGMESLKGNDGILTSLGIKKEFFPVTATVSIAILSIIDAGVFLALIVGFGFIPTWTLILIPIPLIMLLFLILGISYFLSIASIYAKDVYYGWTIATHALFFLTPIFWFLKDTGGMLTIIHQFNPLGQLIEIAHQLVVYGEIPPVTDWLHAVGLIAVIFILCYIFFKRYENKVVEEL